MPPLAPSAAEATSIEKTWGGRYADNGSARGGRRGITGRDMQGSLFVNENYSHILRSRCLTRFLYLHDRFRFLHKVVAAIKR